MPSVTFLPSVDATDDSTDVDYVKTRRVSKQPDFVPVTEENEAESDYDEEITVEESLSRDNVSQTEKADVFTKVCMQEFI